MRTLLAMIVVLVAVSPTEAIPISDVKWYYEMFDFVPIKLVSRKLHIVSQSIDSIEKLTISTRQFHLPPPDGI